MIRILKSRLLWQLAGGFVIGSVGMLSLQPATATDLDRTTPTTIAAHR